MNSKVSLCAPGSLWTQITDDLLSTPDLERAGAGFAGIVRHAGSTQLLLRDWVPVPHNEYLVQLGYHLEVSPVFWARAAKRCRMDGEALVIMHSHPRDEKKPCFSPSDDGGERVLVPKIRARAEVPVAAVVLSPGGATGRCREAGDAEPMNVWTVGSRPRHVDPNWRNPVFDRQVLALGQSGQSVLASLKVGVVGAGGLGCQVIQQLVHLGVSEIVAVDPDRVTVTNLSRLVGATRLDATIRRRKTAIARRTARRLGGLVRVLEVPRTLSDIEAGRRLLDCDVVFGCTDNQVSRTLLNQLAFQLYVPVIDLGVELQTTGAMGGRVAWLSPGSACLWCMGLLDAETVRIEQLPDETRREERQRGYIRGVDEPAPAIVSINAVVASLGVTEMLARVTGFTGPESRSTLLLYRLDDGVVRRASPTPVPGCPTCSASGTLGAGHLVSTPWSDVRGRPR